jgi:hypothetical protein
LCEGRQCGEANRKQSKEECAHEGTPLPILLLRQRSSVLLSLRYAALLPAAARS